VDDDPPGAAPPEGQLGHPEARGERVAARDAHMAERDVGARRRDAPAELGERQVTGPVVGDEVHEPHQPARSARRAGNIVPLG
jgi:hypothetical protein